MKKSILQKIIPFDDLYATIKRFPLSVICAICLFVIGILWIHEFVDDKSEWLGKLSAILIICYFWFGISKLISESQGWSFTKYIVVSFIVAGLMSALVFMSSLWAINLIFVIPALLLTLMIAPYLTSGDDISVWFFNRMTWFGVIVSYAALIMFAGGFGAALGAINILFDAGIKENIYFDIWLFASLIIGPIYALSWVPKTFKFSDDDCRDPGGLKFIVNWISVPMVFVYLLILYAYFIKIIVTGEIPNGHLAYMITGFAGAGIVTYLVAYPLRNEGSLQLKLFYKIFFPALIIPVGFHFYAIWERISAYGITEQRYLILISAIWFLLIAVSNSISKMPIKAIPATLAILMIFASFGPWGGISVSGYSQVSRLETLLTKNALLVDGSVTKVENKIPFDDRLNISSILHYLCKSGRDDMIEPWFNTENKENWKCSRGRILTKQLGFEYVNRYTKPDNNDHFYLTFKSQKLIDIKEYEYLIINKRLSNSNKTPYTIPYDNRELSLSLSKKGFIKLTIENDVIFDYSLKDFVANNMDNEGNIASLNIENDKISARLHFSYIRGKIENDNPMTNNMSFDLLFSLK